MNKKKIIALALMLQIVTLICSVFITRYFVMQELALEDNIVANTIRGEIVYIGAPTQDSGMADSYIVYIRDDQSDSDILKTVLITPETWLFDGHGGEIWEKCLNSETAVNPYLSAGIKIEAQVYSPDDSISKRYILLYPARTVEILAED